MWLAQGTPSNSVNIWIAVIGGLGVLGAAITAGFFTLRGSSKNASVERATEFDKRVDQELDEARARIVALEQAAAAKDAKSNDLHLQINDLQNRLSYAHYILASHQIDPRILDEPEAGNGRRSH